jgi:hypothetical protein
MAGLGRFVAAQHSLGYEAISDAKLSEKEYPSEHCSRSPERRLDIGQPNSTLRPVTSLPPLRPNYRQGEGEKAPYRQRIKD